VHGSKLGYGRVDIRGDSKGNLYVLEVNNNCSFAANSYLEMSLLG
jgi:D-alanine-D-alanine ligase-like ATP-grasp enzyme